MNFLEDLLDDYGKRNPAFAPNRELARKAFEKLRENL